MNVRVALAFVVCILVSSPSWALDLTLPLQQELDAYIEGLNNKTGNELAEHLGKITSSGLSDDTLFDNVRALLNSKHQALMGIASKDKIIIHQVVTMLRTLASSGNKEYVSTLTKVMSESKNRAVRNRAKHVITKIDFYRDRNKIMQDLSQHVDGQSLHTTRILNLLKHENLIMSRFAAEELVREGKADTVVQEWLAQRLASRVHQLDDKLEIDTFAWYAKVLGTVNKAKYADLLKGLINDKSVDYKIRRHAKKILKS
ncbi:hypothetical protein [Agaribacter marinus]|uniref:Uncharacterized protein n=1 Tax=Agaribacter marinus TaxID=1431249 RepID=A0AA37SWC5_9ALTE|nr:hypothetical protein [Agaribacter marinus]GLR70812.1 hypothetical protein GCM10007852_17200 [Agaribacter marinus]